MQTISTNELHYNKDRRSFAADISDLSIKGIQNQIKVFNPKTSISKVFTLVSTDGDEDIYGWNFENLKTKTKLLIIND